MKILAKHKWVVGATITESYDEKSTNVVRRFTATIRGFKNWKIFEGKPTQEEIEKIVNQVRNIRDRIDQGDESVFHERSQL